MTDPIRLADEFPPSELKDYVGRGGKRFTYVEDETVMDRLDSAYEVLHWSWHVEPVGPDVVKGNLRITWSEGGESEWEDFGYASNAEGELLKEAATDAFRRVARMPGVARYVYAGKAPVRRSFATTIRDNAQRTAVALADPVRQEMREMVGPTAPPEPVWQEPENVTAAMQLAEENPDAAPVCKIHKKPMAPSQRFGGWYCQQKMPDGSWCKERKA